jgi:flagellar biosynthesis GTPase FlhF
MKNANDNTRLILILAIIFFVLVGAIAYLIEDDSATTIRQGVLHKSVGTNPSQPPQIESVVVQSDRKKEKKEAEAKRKEAEELERLRKEREELERLKRQQQVELERIRREKEEAQRLKDEAERLAREQERAQLEAERRRAEEEGARLRANGLVESYVTRIGPHDKYSSRGVPLKKAAEIVRQDRANYYRFYKRDPEDMPDQFFSSMKNRALLEKMVRRGTISRKVKRAIVYDYPLIRVNVYKHHVDIELE